MIETMEPRDHSAPTPNDGLQICKQCDLVVEIESVEEGELSVCPQCLGAMARHYRHPFETSLSFALAALVPLAIVLAYPFLTLSVAGQRESSTVADTAYALLQHGFPSIGILVLLMTLALPMLRLFAFIYVLAPLLSGPPAPYAWLVFRTSEIVTPWAMLDVFLLGVLVAVIKLLDLASVDAEAGLFAFVALMLLMVAASATLDRAFVWNRIRRDAV